jgi:arabinose-5-phosphate isomerase
MRSSAITKKKPNKDLEVAEGVLRLEANALHALADSLNGDFLKAVDLIDKTKGRLIITGMGKSGHVARKIAATFASTGTPAHFVHPGEASHGDLGMIGEKDVVLALSNSGKAPELRDLIIYTRRFDITLIAMTSNPTSPLGQEADVILQLPKQPEAGELALAPTTSTTMQMALGDALAITVMERKGFKPENFHKFHPGGQLGKQLIKVRELMHKDLPLISESSIMSEALVEMTAKGFGCVGIVNKLGELQGIITDGDLRRHMSPSLTNQRVTHIMTAHPRTITSDMLAVEALAVMTMKKPKVTNLFVVDEGKPVGVIHMHDLLRAGVA